MKANIGVRKRTDALGLTQMRPFGLVITDGERTIGARRAMESAKKTFYGLTSCGGDAG
ncbi:hypothetical protein KCP70_00330 [Salmonella enterica subsp. enterica]|nr:hypothetical protein KCP70_00330 [Salmonella enterica subsp. enterica]